MFILIDHWGRLLFRVHLPFAFNLYTLSFNVSFLLDHISWVAGVFGCFHGFSFGVSVNDYMDFLFWWEASLSLLKNGEFGSSCGLG